MQNNIGEARRSYSLTVDKFTQEDAAKAFGVSLGTYRNWEQGIGKLNGEILCAIADKYGCSTDYLLCRVSDPTPYKPASRRPSISPDVDRLLDAFDHCTKREQDNLVSLAETMADGGHAKNNEVRPDKADSIGA